jgi:hypothetical protein
MSSSASSDAVIWYFINIFVHRYMHIDERLVDLRAQQGKVESSKVTEQILPGGEVECSTVGWGYLS